MDTVLKKDANALPEGFEFFADAAKEKFLNVKKMKDNGGKVVGVYCSYVPNEVIYAAGAVPVALCATSEMPIKAGERDLPVNLCPLIKASYGHAITDTCPFFYFSDIIVGETTCDGKKKMFEILNDVKRTHVMQLPPNNTKKNSFTYWEGEVREFIDVLEDFYGVEISDEDLRKAIKESNEERQNLIDFYSLGKLTPPPLTGLEIFNVTEAFGFQLDRKEKNRQIREKVREMRKYWEENLKGKSDDRPRILLTGCPQGGVKEKLIKTIEDLGAVIVAFDSCSGLRSQMRFVDEDPDRDPVEALGERYLCTNCSVMSPNPGRIDDIRWLAEEYKVDAIVEMTLVACHTFNIESREVGKFAESVGLPYIHLESDYSQEDKGQILTRIEAFLEIVRQKKEASA